MEELRVSSLSYEQVEKICEMAEEAARKNITLKVPSRQISDLSIMVNLEGAETINVEVDVEITLSSLSKGTNAEKLADEAVQAAFEAVGTYLRESGCRFSR